MHGGAHGLVHRRRDQVVRDRSRRVDPQKDQGGRHQSAANHAGETHDDPDAEGHQQDGQGVGRQEVVHSSGSEVGGGSGLDRGGATEVSNTEREPLSSRAVSTSPSASSIVLPVVSTGTIASYGPSYGDYVPVNSGLAPRRA